MSREIYGHMAGRAGGGYITRLCVIEEYIILYSPVTCNRGI
jgi:hypothetical protein